MNTAADKDKPRFMRHYDKKTRFSLIGTVGSGKSTIGACTLITAHTKSNDEPNFYCRTIEHKSNIRVAASNLRRGIFPPKTVPTGNSTYEAGLEITWEGLLGEKHVHIPIVDVAGEDIQFMLEEYNQGVTNTIDRINYLRLKELVQYIKESTGFIMALPAPRAYIGNDQVEAEPEDLAADPDVNLSRLLEQIINYKRLHRGEPIKFVAVMITKYDLFQDYALQNGMDLYTAEGIDKFMRTLFPDTNMQLKYLRDKGLVKFYPSYVSLTYDEHGQLQMWNVPDRDYHHTPIVARDSRVNKPRYAETSYMTLFDDLEPFAS